MFSELQPLQTNQERGKGQVVASVVKQLITSWLPAFLKAMTVDNKGQATISLDSHDEVYTMSCPTTVATGILGSSPRMLLTGGVSITCSSHRGRMELTLWRRV